MCVKDTMNRINIRLYIAEGKKKTVNMKIQQQKLFKIKQIVKTTGKKNTA